jgi:alpha-mannosidase
MPYDTFLWEGIDGTEVLTHFIPASDYDKSLVSRNFFTTYNGMLDASQIKGAWQRYQQKYLNSEVLFAYGYGDGGGGPTKEMLEHQRRLSEGIPGSPKTKQASTKEFFHTLEKKVDSQKYLPKWSGELYLEYHRGTYTSMARNKKLNRKSEFLLHNIEMFSAIKQGLLKKDYPKTELDELWEILLRNQFHDILPGSSIKEVYETSLEEYKELTARGNVLLEKALMELTEGIDAGLGDVVVYNPNGFKTSGYVEVPAKLNTQDNAVTDGNKNHPIQILDNGNVLIYANDIPSAGFKTFQVTKEIVQEEKTLHINDSLMENKYLRVIFNEKGQFESIYDKVNQREVLKPGQCGNVLMSYEDRPHNWDAWDVNNYYIEKSWEIDAVSEMKIEEAGDLRICMKITRPYLNSVITQYIYMYHNDCKIEVKNVIDWKENHVFVKALFPVDIHANEAVYEIQYGNVKRQTHSNTSWDCAKFEVCHHKWLDYSEDGYGVSLLNDCKYGCNIKDGVIGLSLLKSATDPNPEADKEVHEFTYSLYPHKGDFKEAKTAEQAYMLNNPLIAKFKHNSGGVLPKEFSAAQVSADNIMLEVIKAPEANEDLVLTKNSVSTKNLEELNVWGLNEIPEVNKNSEEVITPELVNVSEKTGALGTQGTFRTQILRLYEYYNRRIEAVLTLPEKALFVYESSMLEDEDKLLATDCQQVVLNIKPYEIITLKIVYEEK